MGSTRDCMTAEVISRLERHFEWEKLDDRCHGQECTLEVDAGKAPSVTIYLANLDPRRRPVQYLTLTAGQDAATTLIHGQDYERDIHGYATAPFPVIVEAIAAASFKGRCGPMAVWAALLEADHRCVSNYGDDLVGPRLPGLPWNFEIRNL